MLQTGCFVFESHEFYISAAAASTFFVTTALLHSGTGSLCVLKGLDVSVFLAKIQKEKKSVRTEALLLIVHHLSTLSALEREREISTVRPSLWEKNRCFAERQSSGQHLWNHAISFR